MHPREPMANLVKAAAVVLAVGIGLAAWPRSAAAAETSEGDRIVAVVRGEEIHMSDVIALRDHLTEKYRDLPLEVMFPVLLERLIDQKLIAIEARESGIESDPEVRKRIARLRERLIQEAFLRRYLDSRLTDDVLREHYRELIRKAPLKDQLLVRHILVPTREEALAAIAELDAGRPFAEVARRRSISPSAKKGGSLGYIQEEDVVPEFAEAAFALQAGEYTREPVRTGAGWQVILVEERRVAPKPTFEETREKIVTDLSSRLIAEYVRELRRDAEIRRFNLDGSPRNIGPASAPLPKTKPARSD